MALNITAKRIDTGRIVTAERHIWHIHAYRELFEPIVFLLVEMSIDFVCIVCQRNHRLKSNLLSCLRSHRASTVNYYLDHVLERIET